MTEVIDVSRDAESGEITQFTILDEKGQPQLVKGTAENLLLWDPDDELPFENGLYEFLSGQQALVLSEDEPEIIVAPTNNEYCYIIRVDGSTVETTPNQSERVLRSIKDAAIDGSTRSLIEVYRDIMDKQVRRSVVNALLSTFDGSERIKQTSRGWLVDDFYLVNWKASMYTRRNDPNEPDYKRESGGVKETDRSYEFVQLNLHRDIESVNVAIGGEQYRLTEREMLFLAKVKWLLNRRKHHPDQPFWMYVDKWSSVNSETGEPEKSEEDERPDLDEFEL
jgi:hypothetical protein